MPYSTDTAGRARRPVNPVTASADELCAHLATDPAAGLSPKEAERRLARSTARPLFRKPPRRYADCLKQTVKEPALWLLLSVAVISLFFDRIALGLVCVLLAAGNAALCAYFLYRADRTDAAMLAYDTPLARVLRGRRLIRVSADGLVKGDIILLAKGDIVPADCRLLRTDAFAVSERELDATDTRRPAVYLDKDAAGCPDTVSGLRTSPVNMAFAGGMVETGTALAVVVAVGSETHLGGLIGSVPTAHQGRPVTLFKQGARVLSVVNLCLVCLIIPLTAVGIFTLGERYEFLDIFLSALALASLTLTEHLLSKGYYMASATRRAAALDRDSENTAEIKSAAVHERLTAMTDLILVGTAALHDGDSHPETLHIGDRVYRCDQPDNDDAVKAVAEYLYLYRHAAALPTVGQTDSGCLRFIPALCEWAEIDTDALLLRVRDIRTEGTGVSGIFPTADGNCRVTVMLTDRFDEAEACDRIYDTPAGSDARNALYRTYREAIRRGSTPVFLMTEMRGERTLRAMITYTAHVCRKTAGCVKNLEGAGIRVSAFLHGVSDSHTRVLAACGLTEGTPADRPMPDVPRTPAAAKIAEGCRAFEGCSDAYILDAIRDLKAEGRTVGVLAVDGEDISLLAEADVAFACTPSFYAAAEAGIACLPAYGTASPSAEPDGLPDGLPNGRVANDRTRRCADVLVRRSSAGGGGVLGVRRALQAADSFKGALDRTLRFILLSQSLRAVMTVLPLCLGLSIAAAPVLLLSGLILDLLVMAASLSLPLGDSPAPRRPLDEGLTRLHRTHRAELIAAAAGAVLPWIVAGIAALAGVEFGGDLLYYGLLCTIALQLAVYRTDRLPRRDSTVFFATLALALAYVGGLAAALVGGLGLLWTLPIPLAAPLTYLVTRAVLLRVWPDGKQGSTAAHKG